VELALRAGSPDLDFLSDQPSSTRRAKALVAGVAVATAGVLAVSPVAPPLPDLQERAVHLSAFANPITPWTDIVTNLVTSVSGQAASSSATFTELAQALSSPTLYTEFAEFVGSNALNPLPILTSLLNISSYSSQVTEGNAAAVSALVASLAKFPEVLTSALNHLAAGQFVEVYADLDIYFLVNLLEQPAKPLFPLLSIPGDIAATIPGGERLATILDTFLKRSGVNGLAKAFLVAPITASLAFAEGLDVVRTAFETGDSETGVSELINLPARVVGAFINGYEPNFEVRSTFPGLLGNGGPIDYFFNDLPAALVTALTASPTVEAAGFAAPPMTAIEEGSPTDISIDGRTFAVNVQSAGTTTGSSGNAIEGSASDTGAGGDGTGIGAGVGDDSNAIDSGNDDGADGTDDTADAGSDGTNGASNNNATQTNSANGDAGDGNSNTGGGDNAGDDSAGGDGSGDGSGSGNGEK
jgi:hypothetical protein